MARESVYVANSGEQHSKDEIEKLLSTSVYTGKKEWEKFRNHFLLGLGMCFTLAGIIFFFAYNWDDMGKVLKMGIPEMLIIGAISLVLFTKMQLLVKQITLTGASVLVGALLAVYGQIYQTGADTYELFLTWTVCIAAWTFAARFFPLWFFFIVLINTTLWLFCEQAFYNRSLTLLSTFNFVCLCLTEFLSNRGKLSHRPLWFINTIGVAVAIMVVINACDTVYRSLHYRMHYEYPLLIWSAILFPLLGGFIYGIFKRHLFYISATSFCCLLIMSVSFFLIYESEGALLGAGLLTAGGTTLLIWQVVNLKKKWNNGNK